jgi:hypothetical protein
MPEPLDQLNKQIELAPGILKQVGKQFEHLQETISLNPTEREMTEALGQAATVRERDAYRQGHQSGWHKGALMFGCAMLAGFAILSLAISGESEKSAAAKALPGPVEGS